jgi:Nitrile hydratase, alpha chain
MAKFEDHGKKVAQFFARTWRDDKLKGQLKSDPKGTLRKHGFTIPDDVELKVLEDTPKVRHVVLPAAPKTAVSADDPGIQPQITIPF